MRPRPDNPVEVTLRWLVVLTLMCALAVSGVRYFFADIDEDLSARGANERARLFIGEEIVAGILGVEKDIYRLATAQNMAGFERTRHGVDAALDKLAHDLNVLQQGGTVQRKLRLNVGGLDESLREASYQPDARKGGYVLEVIEILPQLDQVRGVASALEALLRARWQAVDAVDRRRFFAVEEEIALLLKQVPPNFERLDENANRLFLEGDQRVRELEAQLLLQRKRLQQLETALIALVILLGGSAATLLARRLTRALADARKARTEIEGQRQQSATMLATLSDGVYATDTDGLITFVNPAAERILGWDAHELVGRQAHGAIHHTRPGGEHFAREDCPLIGVLADGLPRDGEEHFIARDGRFIPVSYRSQALLRDGRIIGSLLSFQDISARQQSEARIRLQQAALDATVNMVEITDRAGVIEYVNPAFCQATGYSREEAIGRKTSLLKSGRQDAAFYQAMWSQVMQGRSWEGELINRKRDGSEYPEQMSITPLRQGARITHFVAIKRDITEEVRTRKRLQQAEEVMREARDQALENSRLKSEFLSTMSHEIRTPMNGIIGMTELLLDTPLDAEQQEYTGLVKESAAALLTIINDILDFSKIEAGKLEIEHTDFALRQVLEGSVQLLQAAAADKGLRLQVHCNADLPPVLRGDPTRLRQVLLNLVGNAVKFTARGGVQLRASCVDGAQQALLRVEVSDSGIGIPPETLKRLFQSFSQADSSTTRKYGGTGLGLAICKRLVEMMGGEIGVVSQPGEGTTFWFTLPLQASADTLPGGVSGGLSDAAPAELVMEVAAQVSPAVPTSSPDPHEAVDFSHLEACFGDTPEVIRNLLGLYARNTGPQLAQLREAVVRRDGAAVQACAHELKSSCGNLGFHAMSAMVDGLRTCVADVDWAGALAVCDALDCAHAQVLQAIAQRAA